MAKIDNIFDVGARALSAQMVRMNTTASNLANAGTVASSVEEAFRPLRPVFEAEYSDNIGNSGLATAKVSEIVQLDRAAEKVYQPEHPLADNNGFVWRSTVSVEEEMVEMMEASRQYQNTLEAMSTLRSLMARTLSMGS
jgi:flagellar basal-body rod protein FlgC